MTNIIMGSLPSQNGIDPHLQEVTAGTSDEIDMLALSRLSLFSHVNMDQFGTTVNSCLVLQLAPGEVLLQRGQSNDRMYVVIQGRLSIHLEEGGEVFAILNHGETVGEMSRCVLRDRPLSLLLVDIDHFECFNQKHGNIAADQVLRALANALLIGLRGLDMAVRYGREDFLVVLPGADINEAEKISARLHHAIEQVTLFGQNGKQLPNVTVSIGIAGTIENDYAELLIARAEASLSRARKQRGNSSSQ